MSDRDPDRDEDEEPDEEEVTDHCVRYARANVLRAVAVLVSVMENPEQEARDRIEAARTLLEVGGCL